MYKKHLVLLLIFSGLLFLSVACSSTETKNPDKGVQNVSIKETETATPDKSVGIKETEMAIKVAELQLQQTREAVKVAELALEQTKEARKSNEKAPESPAVSEPPQVDIEATINASVQATQQVISSKNDEAKSSANITTSSLFSDKFDTGIRSEWRVLEGSPVINDGKLAIGEGNLLTLEIDNPSENYSVEFDYVLASCCNVHTYVYVDKKFRYTLDAFWSKWEVFQDNKWVDVIQENNGGGMKGHLNVVITGNNYQIFINGSPHLELNYDISRQGSVSIGLREKNARIDNFELKAK